MTTCSNPQEKYKQNSWWNMTELYENHWKSTVETLGSTVSVGIIIIVSWDYIIVSCWLVVYLPLWKIWIRQLGLWHSQYMEKWKPCSKPPTRLALSSQILSWKSKKWLKPATHEETKQATFAGKASEGCEHGDRNVPVQREGSGKCQHWPLEIHVGDI